MFYLKTQTKWQKGPTDLKLRDLKEAFSKYPLIESKFFEDLLALVQKNEKYFTQIGLLQVKDNKGTDMDPNAWILIWAIDNEERYYQVLVERNPEYGGKGAIAAAAPDDFFEFMSGMKHKMLLPWLGMVNTPEKMKRVGVIVSQPKSYTERKKEEDWIHALGRFEAWTDQLKMNPNVEGKWFPGDYPRCPECNNPLIGIQDEKEINLGHLICPFCGFKKSRTIAKGKRAASFYELFRK